VDFCEFSKSKIIQKQDKFQCKICGSLKEAKEDIEEHFNINHQMDFTIYLDQYGENVFSNQAKKKRKNKK